MAEAQSSDVLPQPSLFFCHKCSAHIVPRLPEYECPRCHNGFIEPSGGMSNSSSSSDAGFAGHPGASQDGIDADSDEAMDDFDPERDFFMNLLPSAAGGSGSSFLWGGGGGDGSRAGGSSSSGESNSSGSGRRGGNRHRGHTLLMGLPQRRSRMRGPERHQVLAPLLQDLIVHISGAPPPFGLLTEELAANPGDYVWGRGGLDAVITHFMGQLENTGPAPLSAEQISAIPSTDITEELCKNNAQCSVCMEDFVFSESVKKLRCEHLFHEPCISPWLKMHATCPVCRTSLSEPSAEGGTSAQTTNGAPRLSSSRILFTNGGSSGDNTVWIATPATSSGVAAASHPGRRSSSSSNRVSTEEATGGTGTSSSSTLMEDDLD